MKAVLVTGAAGGIGKAICQRLQAEGYRVIGCDRSETPTAIADWLTFDLELLVNDEGIAQFTEKFERLLGDDALVGLVNNAAVQMLGGIELLRIAEVMTTLSVNVVAPLALSQLCFPHLKSAQGTIVNVGSIHAKLTKPGFVAYATSKAALEGLTRALAVDCGDRVRVNAVSPAAVDTEMLRAGFREQPESFAQLGASHPVNRIASTEEVAIAVCTLLSKSLPFANGAIWNLDGGIGGRLFDPI